MRTTLRVGVWVALPVSMIFIWMTGASFVWHLGVQRPFHILGWWDATKFFGANWWATMWIVLSAIIPTIWVLLPVIIIGRSRYSRQMSLTAAILPANPRGPMRGVVRANNKALGDADTMALQRASKVFRRGH